jgi:hypothetical protein
MQPPSAFRAVATAVAVAALLFGIYGVVSPQGFKPGYEPKYAAAAEGFLHTGVPKVLPNSPLYPLTGQPPGAHGKELYPGPTVGWAGPITAVPWMIPAIVLDRLHRELGAGSSGWFRVHAAYSFAAALTALTGAVVFLIALLLFVSIRRALFLALAFGLTTLALPYSRIGMEPPLVFWTAAAFGATLYAARRRSTAWWVVAGICLAFAAGTRMPAAPLLTFPLLAFAAWRAYPRFAHLAAIAVPYAAGGVLSGFYNNARCGAVLCLAHQNHGDARVRGDIGDGLLGLLFSPGKSIFVTSPLVVFGVVGIVRGVRARRPELFVIGVTVALGLVVFATLSYWSDEIYGARYALYFVPLLMIAVGYGLRWDVDPSGRIAPTRGLRISLAALVAAGALVQAVAIVPDAGAYPCGYVLKLVGPQRFDQNLCRFVPELSDVVMNARLTVAVVDLKLGGRPRLTYEPFVGPPGGEIAHRYSLELGTPGAPLDGPDFFWARRRSAADVGLLACFLLVGAAGLLGVRWAWRSLEQQTASS